MSTESSLLETFVKFRNPGDDDTSEASILELLPLLPNDCLATFKDDENGSTFLHLACSNGWYEITKVLVEKYKCDPNCRTKKGSTPLLFAYHSGNNNLINYLITTIQCNPLEVNDNGWNRLHCATFGGQLGVVKDLVEKQHCDPGCKTNDGMTPLHMACEKGWLDIAKYLIEEQNCDTGCTDNNGGAPMHYASAGEKVNIVKYLTEEQRCDPNCTTNDGWTPMHYASREGKLDFIKYLTGAVNCDSNCKSSEGWTPLHLACYNKHIDIIKYLVEEQHCDLDCKTNDGKTLLHLVSERGYLDLIRYFIEEQNCYPHCKQYNCETPLHIACQYGQLDVAKYLIEEQHCDPCCTANDGWTPMHFAGREGKIDIIQYLIEVINCDSNCKNSNGWTPLHLACYNRHMDIIKYFVEKKRCDLDCRTNDGKTPLHLASEEGYLDIVKYLIEKQYCDPACKQNTGMTPLHIACQHGQLDVAKYLIEEQHCDPSYASNGGWTPMHYASRDGKIDIIKYLIEVLKCDSNGKNGKGWTPLHLASYNNHIDIIKYLVEGQHCDLDCRTNNSRTLLHLASEMGYLDVIKYLIEEQHCDPNCKQDTGMTSLNIAYQYGWLEVVKYLIEEQHCDPCRTINDGWTPMHYASRDGKLDIIKYLTDASNCDSSCRNSEGWTACKMDIFKYLFEKQYYDLDSKTNDGKTPLHLASEEGHLDMVKYLIEELKQHGDSDCRTDNGDTPMHLACLNGHLKIVKYLVEMQSYDLCCKNNSDETPLHYVCQSKSEALNLFCFLVESECYDLTNYGQTLLQYASKMGHFNICKILTEEYNYSPLATPSVFEFECPLQISMESDDVFLLLLKNCIGAHEFRSTSFKTRVVIEQILATIHLRIAILDLVDHHRSEIASLLATLNGILNRAIYHQLVWPAIKVFVVGNSLSGKSTLIEAVKTSTKKTLSGLFSWGRKVSQVAPHTTGIIPVHIQNDKIGRIIMYDFAGHYEYYSSHAALLETFAFSKGTMVIILLDLREDVTKLVKILEYWQSFIRNSTYLKTKGPPVLVMGSHTDILISEGIDPSIKLSLVLKRLKNPLCNTGVDLNCTLLSSEGLNRLNNVIKEYYNYSFKNYGIHYKVHFLKIFVIKKHLSNSTACPVSSLMCMIKGREEFSTLHKCGLLPLTIDELSQALTVLSECGQLLYLKNSQDLMKGWVVLKPLALLSQINGTIFSSSNCAISSETGIVPLSKIKELFRHRHHMIINLMTHLEFCHRIGDSEVLLINKYLFSSADSDSSEEYYFFPALVEQERPKATWESMKNTHYRCGWCLQRREGVEDQFLSPRFIHVLLLHLTILFGQNPDERCKSQSISIHRECNVWKNGIHFQNMDGVATIVEVVEQSTAVIMVMGCLEGSEMNCVRHRSELIQIILQTKEQFSGTVEMNECLIHPMELSSYPLKSLDCLITFSINRLARAIVERKKVITRHGTPQGMEKIDSVLHFESFVSLTPEIILKLFDETNANLEFEEPFEFLHDCAKVMYPDMIQLKEILLKPEQESELIGTIEQCRDQYSKDPVYQCFSVLRTWMKFTENPTYKGLQEALGMYSVFRGRNPLVSQLCKFCALLMVQGSKHGMYA